MALTHEQLQKIATLARVDLPDDAIVDVTENVSRIVDFFDVLNEVDTHGIETMSHPLDMTQRLRADEVTEDNHREKYQASSAQVERGLYLVPKVLD